MTGFIKNLSIGYCFLNPERRTKGKPLFCKRSEHTLCQQPLIEGAGSCFHHLIVMLRLFLPEIVLKNCYESSNGGQKVL